MSKTESGVEERTVQSLIVEQDSIIKEINAGHNIGVYSLQPTNLALTNDVTVAHNANVGNDIKLNGVEINNNYFTYSTGTWIPEFTNISGVNYITQHGTWTKTGDLVTVTFDIEGIPPFGFSTSINVNLPFPPLYPTYIGSTCSTSNSDVTGRPYPYYYNSELDGSGIERLTFYGFAAGLWGPIQYVLAGFGTNHLSGTLTYQFQ